jgi:hypothetical protein
MGFSFSWLCAVSVPKGPPVNVVKEMNSVCGQACEDE